MEVLSKVKKNVAIAAALVCSMVAAVACSGDKEAQMKEEISAAYAAATDSINTATDVQAAEKISENLQTVIASIQAKYKDVTENMTDEQKQTIASFYKEQRDLMYKNANATGKKLIEEVSSVTDNAFGAVVSTVSGATTTVKNAVADSINSAKQAADVAVDNAKDAAKQIRNNAKTAVDSAVTNAKEKSKQAADKAITHAGEKANEAVNKAAGKANEEIAKGLNKALGK